MMSVCQRILFTYEKYYDHDDPPLLPTFNPYLKAKDQTETGTNISLTEKLGILTNYQTIKTFEITHTSDEIPRIYAIGKNDLILLAIHTIGIYFPDQLPPTLPDHDPPQEKFQ